MNLTISCVIIIFISSLIINAKFSNISVLYRALMTTLLSWILYTVWYEYLAIREDNYGIVMHEL